MHAELMDFNVALQQALCQKDQLLETYQSELEALRGPMPVPGTDGATKGSVNVWIPSAFLTGTTESSCLHYSCLSLVNVDLIFFLISSIYASHLVGRVFNCSVLATPVFKKHIA